MNNFFRKFSTPFITIITISIGSCQSKKDSIFAVKKDIVESVYASAGIKAVNQYSVIPPVSGILLANLVKEGDIVAVGQVLAQIENKNPSLNADNARLALDQAKANLGNLNELKVQLNTARQQSKLDSINFNRQKELWANGIGTKSQLENRQLAYEASKNNVAALQTCLVKPAIS